MQSNRLGLETSDEARRQKWALLNFLYSTIRHDRPVTMAEIEAVVSAREKALIDCRAVIPYILALPLMFLAMASPVGMMARDFTRGLQRAGSAVGRSSSAAVVLPAPGSAGARDLDPHARATLTLGAAILHCWACIGFPLWISGARPEEATTTVLGRTTEYAACLLPELLHCCAHKEHGLKQRHCLADHGPLYIRPDGMHCDALHSVAHQNQVRGTAITCALALQELHACRRWPWPHAAGPRVHRPGRP